MVFICVEKNKRKLGRRPLSLCLCEIAKTADRAGRKKKKAYVSPPHAKKGRIDEHTCALWQRP